MVSGVHEMSDESGSAHVAESAAHDAHPHVNYLAVFGALIVLTIASYVADKVGGTVGKTLVVMIVLTVACFKAMFVMLYFMHLKFEGNWKFVLLAPTIILAMAIVAALMPDIGSHYYDFQVPQMQTASESEGDLHAGESTGDHGAAPQGH
jgi:cytochrome c oxidase subunit 4